MAKRPPSGRGNPPNHSRFRKGQSGNPRGRPKGSKNLRTILMQAANDQVIASIGGKQRKITKLQATAIQLATKAAGGDRVAMGQFLDWVDEYERRADARPADFPFGPGDLEVLRAVHKRMKKCDHS